MIMQQHFLIKFFNCPIEIRLIPQNNWAWVLHDRMEEAHKFVQEHVSRQILRQKKNHDRYVK